MSRVVLTSVARVILAILTAAGLAQSPPVFAGSGSWLTISGSPPTTISVGNKYAFVPTVSPQSSSERFKIRGKPAWAAFNTYTGALSGTPSSPETDSNIRIYVTEGGTSASLPPFTITVTPSSTAPTSSPPTISGSPATSVNEGSPYVFTPTASDPNNLTLTFSVQNLPSWASFSTSTGTLSGTPTSANVGTYNNIVISTSDGQSSASLAPFSVAVNQTSNGSALVSWTPPTTNTDGSALTDLAGYVINYGTSTTSLNQTIQISNPGTASYLITNLSTGTWYFDVVAYDSAGIQSSASNTASKTVN